MKTMVKRVVLLLLLAVGAIWAFRSGGLFTPLQERLVSHDDATRNMALKKLGKLDEISRKIVQEKLINILGDSDDKKRRFALYALRKIDPADPAAVAAFMTALNDKKEEVQKEAAISLGEAGKNAYPFLIQGLAQQNKIVQKTLQDIIQRTGTSIVPSLVEGLRNPSVTIRRGSVACLKNMGSSAAEAKPALVKALKDPDREVWLLAALTLHNVAPADTSVLPYFIQLIQEKKGQGWGSLTFDTVAALGSMGAAARAAVPVLNEALLEGKDGFRSGNYSRPPVARALQQIVPLKSSLTYLNFDLQQKNPLVRYRAAFLISEMNPLPPSAMGMLVRSLGDQDPFVVARAFYGLTKIGLDNLEPIAETAYPQLIKSLGKIPGDQQIDGFQIMVSSSLARLGVPILPTLFKAVQNRTISFDSAYGVVSKLGPSSTAVLKSVLVSKDDQTRFLAAMRLAQLDPKTPGLTPVLQQAAASKDPTIRSQAEKILANTNKKP